jgi:hypothetical protein
MEAMRDTAWVLTHALVNMTNACLSSSFLRTDRAFGSRFGPVAKWPFCIQTRICKESQFRHFFKGLDLGIFAWLQNLPVFHPVFPQPGFVKNRSKFWRW